MDSLAIAFLLWIQISSSPSYPGKCQYLSGQEAGVQCGTIPEGAEHFLNETLRSIERSQKGSHFSRGLWVKLGEDWSVKFIALKKFLSQNSELSPVIAQIESLISQGKFKAAGELIDSALAGGKANSSLLALLNYARARIYDLQFQRGAAAPYYQKAYQHQKSNPRYGLHYGLKLLDINRFAKASMVFENALKHLKQSKSGLSWEQKHRMGSLLVNLGLVYKKTQNIEEAEQTYAEALEVFQAIETGGKIDIRFEQAVTLDNLGNLYQATRKYKQARKMHTRALQIFRALAREQPEVYQEDLGISLSNLGNLLSTLKNYQQAGEYFEESLAIFRELAQIEGDSYRTKLAIMLDNTGVLYRRMGNLDEAEKIHKEALKVYEQLGDIHQSPYRPDYAITLVNLGDAYQQQQKYAEMEKVYEEALRIFRELSQSNGMAYMSQLALTLLTYGDYFMEVKEDPDSARRLFKEALPLFAVLAKFNPGNFSGYMKIIQKKLKSLESLHPSSP